MAIYKNKDLEVDISFGTSSQNGKSASFYSGDKNSTSIRIKVKHKGNPFNFTKSNLVPTLDLFHSDGSIWLSEPMNIVVGESGVISYNIPNNIIEHVGTVNAKLFLKNDTTSVHAMNFNFEILDSGIEGEVEKEINLVLVEDTVRNIMTENALGLIDETFKTEVLNAFQDYTIANPELFKGDKGDQGDQGVRGPIGKTGAQGLNGAKGDTGLTGATGDRGPQGIQGAKGEKGNDGSVGPQGESGQAGEDGRDSTQINYSDMKIVAELPRRFNNYIDIVTSSGNAYYYPQGLAVTENYLFLAFQPTKEGSVGDSRRILVVYNKSGIEIAKYGMGNFGSESIHVEEVGDNVVIYFPTNTSDIGKATISITPNNPNSLSSIPLLTATETYPVNLLYQFSKISEGWLVELATTSKGTYQQRDLFAIYNDDFSVLKRYVILTASNSTLWGSPLITKSIKRQGLTVYKNELVQIVGGNTLNGDEETNYSNQGVQILSPSGQVTRDYTYSIKEFNEYILSIGKETQRIEHEGVFVYNDEIHSCLVYNTEEAYTGNGIFIVKYGSTDEPDHTFTKGGVVSTAMTGKPFELTPIGTKIANTYTGELIDSMEEIIKYMLATYQERGYLYTSKVKITDFQSATVMASGIYIEITNLNNRTFWVTYRSLSAISHKHVTYEWGNNKFIYNTPTWS